MKHMFQIILYIFFYSGRTSSKAMIDQLCNPQWCDELSVGDVDKQCHTPHNNVRSVAETARRLANDFEVSDQEFVISP